MGMETSLLILIAFVSAIIFILFGLLIVVYIITKPYPNLEVTADSELYFYNAKTDSQERFPSIKDKPTVTLSVIVPAYREEKRLGKMLDEALPYLDGRRARDPTFSFEVIVVDDGSDDATDRVALYYSRRVGPDRLRLLKLARNLGKGGAVRRGMLAARGQRLLFADADGATRFSDLDRLERELQSCTGGRCINALICGSRAHLQQDAVAQRSFVRNLLMHGFHLLVWLCCVRNVKDTQCGFKLLTRDAAHLLFCNLHVERWAFDCDLLYLANQFRVTVREVPVNWTEIDGSKIIPVFSWLQMAFDIVLIRLRYLLGAWKIESRHRLE
uniref:Dolichyl-phosphate beta-glucosyltransferase n=1 Tax=Macrostomum lignano TaxID=282301 RepID=A0A1I8GDS2_9PLAT